MNAPGRGARGLLVGRFQPFHLGHQAVVAAIRAAHPDEELVVAIGSAQEAFTAENPFSASERYEMIRAALEAAGTTGWVVVPLADVRRHAIWVAHAEEILPSFRRVHTNNPLTRHLFERAGYPVDSPPWIERTRFEGRHVRAALAADAGWEELVPAPVATLLRRYDGPRRLRELTRSEGPGTAP